MLGKNLVFELKAKILFTNQIAGFFKVEYRIQYFKTFNVVILFLLLVFWFSSYMQKMLPANQNAGFYKFKYFFARIFKGKFQQESNIFKINIFETNSISFQSYRTT